MALISLNKVSISFTGTSILDSVDLHLEKGERVALLGRNGAGKTTLLKTIASIITPDSGAVQTAVGSNISYFSQDIPEYENETVFEIVSKELELKLAKTSAKTDEDGTWSQIDEVYKVISNVSLSPEQKYSDLSGGQKRRALLAAALVSKPDAILLDEPTNHLDIESINWLEDYLQRLNITIVFVTHDRMLLRKLAKRIVELDRGKLYDWECDYDTFLRRKNELLDAESKEWERFDKKLALEEVWIIKGIQARRTRNEGRVRALKKMREERKLRREKIGKVNMKIIEAKRSGRDVIEACDIAFAYDKTPIIENLNVKITREDKIGIVGPNGCGKTTLVKLLLGHLKPMKGEIKYGTNLEIVYFDQLRNKLDLEKTVWENVCPHGDMLQINDKQIHIITYLENFLFSSERAKTKLSVLSGGERNRVLLAKVFSRPANILVLDEPTNDLDIETLELLEELIADFAGTVLLISHDRTFLNNVVSSTLAFVKNGEIKEIVGGYDEWLNEKQLAVQLETAEKQARFISEKEAKAKTCKAKLSFNEKRELEFLPDKIEKIGKEISEIQTKLADPMFYKSGLNPNDLKEKIENLETEMLEAFEREEELKNKAAN
jgi:ATP-binding cassette subfamily F protein uup